MTEKLETCTVCNMPGVEGCRNFREDPAGGILISLVGEDRVSRPCPNMRRVSLKRKLENLDPLFLKVQHDKNTPLFKRNEIDRTTENCFVPSIHWKTFLAHFKWVVACKPPNFFIRILTDMTLLNVYLGKADFRHREKDQRESLLVSNSLEDLLAGPDLVVLRLGGIVHMNKAAANVLQEALRLRLRLSKATWLIEPSDQEFIPYDRSQGAAVGMPCCSPEVLALRDEHFETVELEGEEIEECYEEDEDNATIHPATESEETESEETESESEESEVDADGLDPDEIDALANKETKPKWRRR